MSETIISVTNLGKKYRISHQGERQRYVALRDVLAGKVKGLFQKQAKPKAARNTVEDFWALKDVSFEIKQGDVVGIIGRNGAGKSTLLKVLSRITEPSAGRVHIKGRVASLLEVGTGFHPELTGRENIFLNGAILGMTRAEIRRKFDEIVEFAEVSKFLDTPVKRYSSGMYVRLAFAVAAHLEPEILIVDEVLAVGDAQFQKKCLGKMQSVSTKEGRTVLFVSHNMDAVSRLCTSAIILRNGSKEFHGRTEMAVQNYLANDSILGAPGSWLDITNVTRTGPRSGIYFESVACSGPSKETNFWPMSERELLFKLRIQSNVKRKVTSLAVVIYSPSFQKLVNADCLGLKQPINLEEGLNEIHLTIDRLHLKPGRYHVGLWLANTGSEVFDNIENAFEIDVTNEDFRMGSEVPSDGVVSCDFKVEQVAVSGK